MAKIELKFKPKSLRYMSEVEVCKSLWNHWKIKQLMQQQLIASPLEIRDENSGILNQVYGNIDKLEELVTSTFFKQRLKVLAKAIGVMVWDWLEEMNKDLLGDLTCYVDYIKWTSDWTIDTAESFRSMYYLKKFPDSGHTWRKLSNYCLEDCLEDFVKRVTSHKKDWPDSFEIPADDFSLYWSELMRHRTVEVPVTSTSSAFSEIAYTNSKKIKMLTLAFDNENFAAFKYFWKFLTEEEKITAGNTYSTLGYKSSTAIDAAISIQKHMAPYGSNMFITESPRNMTIMTKLFSWPWENLFISTLGESWPDVNDSDLQSMFISTCSFMYHYSPEERDDVSKYRHISRQIWSKIKDEKKRFDKLGVCLICLYEHIECLDFVINDPALAEIREGYIDVLALDWSENPVKSALIEQFCAMVLKNDEERALFRQQVPSVSDD